MAPFTKIFSPRKIVKHSYNKTARSMYGGDCDAAIARAAAAVTHVQSQSQEVGSGDEGLGLLCLICHQQKRTFMAGGRAVETSALLSSENYKSL